MKNTSKIALFLSGMCLVISIFVPIWRIELDAPQYPEGLNLLIYSNKLGGNVEIVNGLNHYIGMKTLHADDFIEFTILPYIIASFAALSILTAILGRRKFLNIVFAGFVLFGIIAMIDFWRWEYDYGHNLDPNAAIVVPGMTYQPPLIGFKQLLNFGAFSIPDIGGILFISAGLLMLFAVWTERKSFLLQSKVRNKLALIGLLGFFVLPSCMTPEPKSISYNVDNCDFCKMTISDSKYGCLLLTEKGRTYKFDDLSCLSNYYREDSKMLGSTFYIPDFSNPAKLLDHSKLTYLYSDQFASPMAGNIAAFESKDSATKYAQLYEARYLGWHEILEK